MWLRSTHFGELGERKKDGRLHQETSTFPQCSQLHDGAGYWAELQSPWPLLTSSQSPPVETALLPAPRASISKRSHTPTVPKVRIYLMLRGKRFVCDAVWKSSDRYKAPPAKQPSTNKALGNTIRIVSKDLQSHLKFAWVIQTLLKNTAYYFHSNLGHSSRKVWVQGAHAQTALLQSAPPQVCRQLMCLTTWELNNLYNMPWNSSKASTLPNWSIKLGPGCPKHLYWS